MNREETRKAAEVMVHYANGGEVIRASRNQQDHWTSLRDYDYPDGPLWDWRTAIYRIKPKPIEVTCYAVVHGVLTRNWSFHETRPLALARLHELQRNCMDATDSFIVELKGTYTCDT